MDCFLLMVVVVVVFVVVVAAVVLLLGTACLKARAVLCIFVSCAQCFCRVVSSVGCCRSSVQVYIVITFIFTGLSLSLTLSIL